MVPAPETIQAPEVVQASAMVQASEMFLAYILVLHIIFPAQRHQWVCLRMLKYTCLCLRTAQTFRGCCLIDPISEASQGLNDTFLLTPMRKMGPFQPYRGPKEALKTETPPKAPWARGCPSLCSSL